MSRGWTSFLWTLIVAGGIAMVMGRGSVVEPVGLCVTLVSAGVWIVGLFAFRPRLRPPPPAVDLGELVSKQGGARRGGPSLSGEELDQLKRAAYSQKLGDAQAAEILDGLRSPENPARATDLELALLLLGSSEPALEAVLAALPGLSGDLAGRAAKAVAADPGHLARATPLLLGAQDRLQGFANGLSAALAQHQDLNPSPSSELKRRLLELARSEQRGLFESRLR